MAQRAIDRTGRVTVIVPRGGSERPLRVRPGGHDGRYWRSRYAEYLRFYARALEDCVAS